MSVLTGQQRQRPPAWYFHIVPALLLLLVIATPPHTQADSPQAESSYQHSPENIKEYEVKAAFLYKFCFYVEWPETAFETVDSPLILGVTGPDRLADDLIRIVHTRTVQGRLIEVRRINSDNALPGLHLLFLNRSTLPSSLPSLTDNRPMLVITEDPLPGSESSINFVLDDNRVRFDVQLDSATRRGLRLSAQLLQAARNVHGEMP